MLAGKNLQHCRLRGTLHAVGLPLLSLQQRLYHRRPRVILPHAASKPPQTDAEPSKPDTRLNQDESAGGNSGRRGPSWLRLPFLRRGEESSGDRNPPHHDGQQWRLSAQLVLRYMRTAVYGVLAMCLLGFVRYSAIMQARSAPREVLYSEFVTLLDTGKVRAARLESGNSRLVFDVNLPSAAEAQAATPEASTSGRGSAASTKASAKAAAAAASTEAQQQQQTGRPQVFKKFFIKVADKNDPFLVNKILQAGVEFGVVRASVGAQLMNMLMTMLAVWLPLTPLLFFARHLIEARNGTNKKRKSGSAGDMPKVTFADVAGVGAAKEELREVVACLKNSNQYSKVRARMPSGVLLHGPPGTGKTLLAKAVAGEAGVPFMSVSASEFVELFVGRGAARVRELFAEARKRAPCVVFIDELDAMGAKRGMGFNDERDQTLNQLLTELDGFDGRPGVVLLAATNRMDVLDPALLRPGRLSRRVVVPLPDKAGRAAILGVHLRDIPLEGGEGAKDAAAQQLAGVTQGFSGADLANIVNEAALLSARQGAEEVGFQELLLGVQRTRFGVNGSTAAAGPAGQALQRFNQWLLRTAAGSKQPVKVSTA